MTPTEALDKLEVLSKAGRKLDAGIHLPAIIAVARAAEKVSRLKTARADGGWDLFADITSLVSALTALAESVEGKR